MSSQGLQPITLRQFGKQPAKTFPSGYVCLIRDVAYGNRYRLLRLRDPKQLKRHLLDFGNFETELALAWQAARAEEAEETLRKKLAPGSARDEWFDLELGQLAQLSREELFSSQPKQRARSRTKATKTASKKTRASQRARPSRPAPAAQPQGRRSNSMRSLTTVFILLILLAVVILPRMEGLPLFAARSNAVESGLPAPSSRIEWTGQVVLVSWDKVAGADSYEYRYRINDKQYSTYRPTEILRAILTNVSPGDTVRVEVRSRNGETRSSTAHSTIRIPNEARPAAPQLRSEWTGWAVVVHWDKVAGADSYEYRYRVNAKDYSTYQPTGLLRARLTGVLPGDTVRVEVRSQRGEVRSSIARSTIRIPNEQKTETPAPSYTPTDLPPTATPSYTPTDLPPTATPRFTPTDLLPTATPSYTPTDLPPSATPSYTPTQPPEPTVTPTPAGQAMIVETRNNLSANVRICPRTSCAVIDTLRPGDVIQALGRVEGEEAYGNTTWVQFLLAGRPAFIHSELVEVSS